MAISWYRVPKGAHLTGDRTQTSQKPVLVATGRRTFTAAGARTMTVSLTAAGRILLRRARKLPLTARGTFTPLGKNAVRVLGPFTLHR
jgi:hypothetical protein